MNKFLLTIIIILLPITVFTTGSKNLEKVLHLVKFNSEIIIDGKIDDAWSAADSVTNFFQLEPYYNQPTSVKTVAKVLTTEEALYCLMICYDDKKNIQANAGMQDGFTGI